MTKLELECIKVDSRMCKGVDSDGEYKYNSEKEVPVDIQFFNNGITRVNCPCSIYDLDYDNPFRCRPPSFIPASSLGICPYKKVRAVINIKEE